MNLTIVITQDLIDHGIRRDCERCAVALGVMEHFPGASVEVSTGYIFVWPAESLSTAPLVGKVTKELAKKMNAADMGREVKPFEFPLELN